MKFLFIGDVCGKPGRETVGQILPELKIRDSLDFVIANAENAAGGRGVTRKILNELQGYGVDFFTSGEHVWDQKGFREDLLDENLPIVRPYNYEATRQLPGAGYKFIDLGKENLLVINLIGQTFMRSNARNPFWGFDELWRQLGEERGEGYLKSTVIIVDFHAEATSEKLSLAWYVRDRVDAFLGTHTHVATADERMLGGNMAYVTDVGMTGPYEASLWVEFDKVIKKFMYPFKAKFTMEEKGERIFNSVLIEIKNSKPVSIERIDKIV